MLNAARLYELGFTDVIPVIPPNATLAPRSRISATELGKVPGRRNSNGLWAGFDWRRHPTTLEDARRWDLDGANVGLRTARFPAVDIDSMDPQLVRIVAQVARKHLGPAPRRTGRAPKTLLLYRLAEGAQPFGRARLWIKEDGVTKHLVEVLGDGQQFVAAGIHPATGRAYEWDAEPEAARLVPITAEQVQAFLEALQADLEVMGYECKREGDATARLGGGIDQQELKAPSDEVLADAVRLIPNNNDLFPGRDDYLKVGHAIKAAAHDEETGFQIFAEWAARWEGNDRFPEGNDPETVRADYRRMAAPYRVGWGWLAEQARRFGFNDAELDFDAVEPAPDAAQPVAIHLSEQHLADEFLSEHRGRVRSLPSRDGWLVWDGVRWQMDSKLLAQSLAASTLRRIADRRAREGTTPQEQRAALADAKWISAAARVRNVLELAMADQSLVTQPDQLDANAWVLNTPAGVIDLRTGTVSRHDPDLLLTKLAAVGVDRHSGCPTWERAIAEWCGGDMELVRYLQRLCGYCLTGSTREHVIVFVHGPGGNGKSVFLNTVTWILGDYATYAPMDLFTASSQDRHPTELASLMGHRLVAANETEEGRRWNESRMKGLSAGDPVTARFMRGDFFTFRPQLKLLLVGNHRPLLRNVDEAMRRRFHLVPFTVKPAVIDPDLGEKLRAEAPAILAWMLDGCLAWQAEGLNPPTIVRAATDEYFSDEDALGRWIGEACLTGDAAGFTETQVLYDAWKTWATRAGEHVGSMRRFATMLAHRGFQRGLHPRTRRAGFKGIDVRESEEFDAILNGGGES